VGNDQRAQERARGRDGRRRGRWAGVAMAAASGAALVAAGLAKSKGEARRTVVQGGAYVNNRRVPDVDFALTAADLASESVVVLRSGRKRYALLRFV